MKSNVCNNHIYEKKNSKVDSVSTCITIKTMVDVYSYNTIFTKKINIKFGYSMLVTDTVQKYN